MLVFQNSWITEPTKDPRHFAYLERCKIFFRHGQHGTVSFKHVLLVTVRVTWHFDCHIRCSKGKVSTGIFYASTLAWRHLWNCKVIHLNYTLSNINEVMEWKIINFLEILCQFKICLFESILDIPCYTLKFQNYHHITQHDRTK